MTIDDDDLRQALDRIARSPDGHLLYRFLQKLIMGVVAGPAEAGALNFDLGRRSLARDLMGLMAKGIDESAGSRASESTVVFRRRDAVVASKPRGAGRRISADTPVGGWDK